MPLAFESLSHGRVAFGFFNIETDMILLEHYFFYAQDFCRYIIQAAKESHPAYQTLWEVYLIEHGSNIGNLMGAIHGIDFRGFIGEVYKLFPFPKYQEDFKQKPEGFKNQKLIETFIQRFAKKTNIPFLIDQEDDKIGIGEYLFDRASFQELVKYVWSGGFPRWKNEVRPDYVVTMKEKIEESKNPLFYGCDLIP